MQTIEGVRHYKAPSKSLDPRGSFIKIFNSTYFKEYKIQEVFISKTLSGFVRGMHLQIDPLASNRLISCISGEVFDVLIDLRADSTTFLKTTSLTLSEESGLVIFVPAGVAHGFQSLSDNSEVIYLSDKVYDSKRDTGINPISLDVDWPLMVKGISERDSRLPTILEFKKNGYAFH